MEAANDAVVESRERQGSVSEIGRREENATRDAYFITFPPAKWMISPETDQKRCEANLASSVTMRGANETQLKPITQRLANRDKEQGRFPASFDD